METKALIVILLSVVFTGITLVILNKQTEEAKVSAIRSGATPAQLICAFHPPKTAYSRNKLCSKTAK